MIQFNNFGQQFQKSSFWQSSYDGQNYECSVLFFVQSWAIKFKLKISWGNPSFSFLQNDKNNRFYSARKKNYF